jgi:RHS repeat-associated protein
VHPRTLLEPAEPAPYREPLFSLRRPSRAVFSRFIANTLVRLLIVSALPANLQAAAALFPVSILWPLVAPDDRAPAPSGPENRVRGSDEKSATVASAEAPQAAESRRGCELGYGGSASDRLFNAKARFYDPQLGRFISQDSYLGEADDPPSLHRYFYANDNPTRYIDPTGHASEEAYDDLVYRGGGGAAGLDSAVYRESGADWSQFRNAANEQYPEWLRKDLAKAAKRNFDSDVAKRIVERNQETTGSRNHGPIGAVIDWVTDTWAMRKLAGAGEALERGKAYVSELWGSMSGWGANEALTPSKDGVFREKARGFDAQLTAEERKNYCYGETGCVGAPRIAENVQQIGTESAEKVGTATTRGILEAAEFATAAKVAEGAAVLRGNLVRAAGAAPNRAAFGGVVAATREEAAFLRNAASTFGKDSVYASATRFSGNIVIQRSDIPLSLQNARRMAGGYSPFVRNSAGEWEMINLHHVGRREGRMIEVLQSQNAYNPATGGPLHIPGPGGLVRDPRLTGSYWQQRLQDLIDAGQVPQSVLRAIGR